MNKISTPDYKTIAKYLFLSTMYQIERKDNEPFSDFKKRIDSIINGDD